MLSAMEDLSYFEQVVELLRSEPVMQRHGFPPEHIQSHGKGDNHSAIMKITHPIWRLLTEEGREAGYEGVDVHFEARNPGSFQIDCELHPRNQSESKADQRVIRPLLELKGEITQLLREQIGPADLDRFGANMKHCRRDPTDPSSLKVMGFELGLPAAHSPEQYARKILPIIDAASPMVTQIMSDQPIGDS